MSSFYTLTDMSNTYITAMCVVSPLIVVFITIAVLVFLYKKRKKNGHSEHDDTETDSEQVKLTAPTKLSVPARKITITTPGKSVPNYTFFKQQPTRTDTKSGQKFIAQLSESESNDLNINRSDLTDDSSDDIANQSKFPGTNRKSIVKKVQEKSKKVKETLMSIWSATYIPFNTLYVKLATVRPDFHTPTKKFDKKKRLLKETEDTA